MRTVIICKTHNYRDVPVYEISGDTPECMACVREADREVEERAAYWASRSQCNMCIAGGDCYRHGYIPEEPTPTADEILRDRLMCPISYGTPLAPLTILSPNHCDGNVPF